MRPAVILAIVILLLTPALVRLAIGPTSVEHAEDSTPIPSAE